MKKRKKNPMYNIGNPEKFKFDYVGFVNPEDLEAEAIKARSHAPDIGDQSDHSRYTKYLKRLKAKGIVPGLDIGNNSRGARLAMKYLIKGVGDHVPEDGDKAAYPEMELVTVRLTRNPSGNVMKKSWLIDVIFKSSNEREEMFGFTCYFTDHEITLNREDAMKLGEEIQVYGL